MLLTPRGSQLQDTWEYTTVVGGWVGEEGGVGGERGVLGVSVWILWLWLMHGGSFMAGGWARLFHPLRGGSCLPDVLFNPLFWRAGLTLMCGIAYLVRQPSATSYSCPASAVLSSCTWSCLSVPVESTNLQARGDSNSYMVTWHKCVNGWDRDVFGKRQTILSNGKTLIHQNFFVQLFVMESLSYCILFVQIMMELQLTVYRSVQVSFTFLNMERLQCLSVGES